MSDTGLGRRAVLELRGVSKVYGQGGAGVHAVRDAALSVEAGSVVAVMYAVFAVSAGGVALFSGLGDDRWWGIWAVGGYAAAAALAWSWRSRRGRRAALAAGLAGALAAPLTWLATRAPATPDVKGVARPAALLLHHATPHLPAAQLGVPAVARGSAPPGLRPGPAVARPVPPRPARPAASTRAAATRTRAAALARPARLAAVVLGVACAMKYTAWPALAVLAAMIAARGGAPPAAPVPPLPPTTPLRPTAPPAPPSLNPAAAPIHHPILLPL